jgi:hypothetical protein
VTKVSDDRLRNEMLIVEPHIDWLLQQLVVIANTEGREYDVILNVKGLIIQGTIVSGIIYIEGLRQVDLKNAKTDEQKNNVNQFYNYIGDTYIKQHDRLKNNINNIEDDDYHPIYIHLKNARIFSHGFKPIPVNEGVFWRGKLESVDSFFFGKMSTT